MNTNNDVKWRRFIVPKKVKQINDHLFIDTYKTLTFETKTKNKTKTVKILSRGFPSLGNNAKFKRLVVQCYCIASVHRPIAVPFLEDLQMLQVIHK